MPKDIPDEKLTLLQLRRIRCPVRDKKGKVYTERKFQWNTRKENGIEVVMWALHFDVQGWEWGLELKPDRQFDDTDWTQSDYVIMWIHNYDPNRFLFGIHLVTLRDLTLFLDAFKVEYYLLAESEVRPLEPDPYKAAL